MKIITILIFFPISLLAQQYQTFSNNNKFGIYEGKSILIEPKYDTIYTLSQHEPILFIAKLNGSWGLIDIKEKEVIPIELDRISYLEENELRKSANINMNQDFRQLDGVYIKPKYLDNDYFILEKEFEDYRVKKIYNAQTNYGSDDWLLSISSINNTEYFKFEDKNHTYGIIDGRTMSVLVKSKYPIENTSSYKKDNLFVVSENGKQGIIDKSGKLVFPFKYEKIEIVTADFIHVYEKLDDKQYALTNLKQTYLTPFQFVFDYPSNNDYYMVSYIEKDSAYYGGMIDRNGETIIPFNKKNELKNNFIIIIGGKYLSINNEVKCWDISKENYKDCLIEEIGENDLQSFGKLIRFKQNALYGIMNEKGEIIVAPENKTPEEAWKKAALR